jgi:hypothetical protein
MNFLDETLKAIEGSGHTPDDITFIGSLVTGHACTWYDFVSLADFDYNSGYGAQKIATDLVIAFSDKTYMTRGEYDGSEWWEYNEPLVLPTERKPITCLHTRSVGWDSLKRINDEKEDE